MKLVVIVIKHKIEVELNVPILRYSLFHLNRVMLDENFIGFYTNVPEGDKIYVMANKQKTCEDILERILLNIFIDEHAKLVLDGFMKIFNNAVKNLSPDELEPMAISFKREDLFNMLL